jgi:L-threonylcarbamoyladenylate synthase
MCPVFQTSANRSGEPPGSGFDDLPKQIGSSVDLAIDGGELTGLPSTVVDLTAIEDGGEWKLLREGALPRAELARLLGGSG